MKAPPPNSNGSGQQTRNIWALETSLDVEWAHAIAPEANVLNVTTNPAEMLDVQRFPAMMDTEQYIADHQEATVISQSFGAATGWDPVTGLGTPNAAMLIPALAGH